MSLQFVLWLVSGSLLDRLLEVVLGLLCTLSLFFLQVLHKHVHDLPLLLIIFYSLFACLVDIVSNMLYLRVYHRVLLTPSQLVINIVLSNTHRRILMVRMSLESLIEVVVLVL